MLVRYVAALCPQQKMDEYTPDAWFDVFQELPFDIDYGKCKAIVRYLARTQAFIGPRDIIEELRREQRAEVEAEQAIRILTPGREMRAAIDRGGDPRPLRETIRELVEQEWPGGATE